MIYLYSGTPGSGKSMDVSKVIFDTLRFKNKYVVTNIKINLELFSEKKRKKYFYFDFNNNNINDLINISKDYFSNFSKDKKMRESRIVFIIDEAQMFFNTRNWNSSNRADWNKFFTIHRHLGYDIIFVCQYDAMLDKQIRYLIEYEYIHRKVLNMGWRGLVLYLLTFGRRFIIIKYWYPMKQVMSKSFIYCNRKLFKLYDTFDNFEI